MEQTNINDIEVNFPTKILRKDGISFPERFMYHLLSQCYDGEFQREVTSQSLGWGAGYRYDFIIERPDGRKLIIEMQGRQHSTEVQFGNSSRTMMLDEVKTRDIKKRQLALDNGVEPELYFEIDCAKTEPQSIIGGIMNGITANT